MNRDLRIETLEERRLLAGLQLAGIATNQGALLRDGLIFNEAPKELQFRFNDGATLSPASLASGIEIIRSGLDGTFESARVRSDLNTDGAVIVEFTAVQAGSAGDGITLEFSRNARGLTGGVGITVQGATVKIDLNTTVGARTTALDLRNAINAHPQAGLLIRASISRGNAFVDVAAPVINYSPLRVTSANHARGASAFNQGAALELEFTAVQSGIGGNGIVLNFVQRDFGGAGAPRVTVNQRTVQVELNTHPGSESTAAALIGAINNDAVANKLIRVSQVAGRATSRITSPQLIPSVTLLGANDIVLTPGFVGLGEAQNIAIFRFAENLVDDVYRVNLLARPGGGRLPVSETNGKVFRDGEANLSLTYELDLGAQVVSIVPQPIRRLPNGRLEQARNQIHVYFNDDDLNVSAAQNPSFYELIATNDTVRNTDDVSFRPISVSYDPAADRAVLTFAADLDQLLGPGVAATFRLRIGTDEALPVAPTTLTPATDPGSSFNTALDLLNLFETGSVLVVRADGRSLADGQVVTVISRQGVTRRFEFDDSLLGPQGVTAGNEQVLFSSQSTPDEIALALANAINNVNMGVLATANGNRIQLQNDQRVTFSPGLSAITKASQGLIISSSIDNVGQPYDLTFPGGINEPGHRDIPVENHFLGGPDSLSGITRAFYNFQDEYGFSPQGAVLRNAITEVQKQRVREIFELYSTYLGIQFVESSFSGMTIAVGDMRAIDPTIATGPGGVLGVAAGGLTGRLVMDLQDFDQQNDAFGDLFFRVAMHEIGHLLGYGHDTELPALTIMSGLAQAVTARAEPVFPGDHDLVHGQFLYRPESKDIDLYRFEVPQRGLFTAETIAERLPNASQLDTVLTLYRETANGREVVARNDDSFSEDSFLELLLEPGVYYIGVSASGNNEYDPSIVDSGFGGRSEGAYQLRLNFRGEATNGIIDADNSNNPSASLTSKATLLDGDADGRPGGVANFWFRSQTAARTIYVDKAAPVAGANGSLQAPFTTISAALQRAVAGDIVRIVGNGGADGDITTLNDNLAYEIGFSGLSGIVLQDGATFDVPKGVTVMVDAGAVIKSRRAVIGVGSSSPSVDRSAGALQLLGVPRIVDASGSVRRDSTGQPIVGNVVLTSLHDTIGVGKNPDKNPPAAAPGDWGGVAFRADLDHRDFNRFSYEKQGIFLNSVHYADIRFGGGNVTINGVPTLVDPVHIADSRPTVAYSTITRSAHAAISANPNSFEESNFHSPEHQLPGVFTSDYSRAGPHVHGNRVTDNTINGMFIRIRTAPGAAPEQLTVSARLDDVDIVHVLQENLIVTGTPGGPVLESVKPPVTLVTSTLGPVGGTLTPGVYNYRITFVDANGTEGPASDPTTDITVPGNPDVTSAPNVGITVLGNLPTLASFPNFASRRIYRSTPGGTGPYTLVAEINATNTSFTDNGTTVGGPLQAGAQVLRSRQDARLRLDPGTILKSEGAIIDVQMGANLIVEGNDGDRVVMTSVSDRRYGAAGTFNTNSAVNGIAPSPGDWGGIFVGHAASASLDHALIAYAGGVVRTEGGFRGFNALELHQAQARVAHSTFEFNASGVPSNSVPGNIEARFGRGFNRPSVIFVRGAQPVIVENVIRDNRAPAISINVNSLNSNLVNDLGRATGMADIYGGEFGNRGPLVSGNRVDKNDINGMSIRAGTLTTEGVWDDTDIVHVVEDEIEIPDFHTYGGLRLLSRATESLVIKAQGANAGFTTSGKPLDIDDRIGGAVQVVGHPRHPVVMTSLQDCSVGAGFTPDGSPQTDTANSGRCGPVSASGFADIIVVMDESGSMFAAQQFSIGLIANLDQQLAAAGIGDGRIGFNQFGLVGFSDSTTPRAFPVGAGGALFGTSVEYAAAAQNLTIGGFLEDGWEALQFTANTYQFRPSAAKFIILVTDEDRDPVDLSATFANTLAAVQGTGATLEGILGVSIVDGNNLPALALDSQGTAFLADGAGGFTTSPGGSIQFAFGTTQTDYVDMAFATGGIVGDISQISQGGLTAASFGQAMVSAIVVQAGGNPAKPGDWRSIRLDEYSHDRNVDLTPEIEPFDSVITETNGTTASAEFLGDLAPHEKAGDDNLRLGFTVHGAINNPKDLDVYRFTAEAGTEVWFDIDRTTHSLDTVVELISANGEVLARSNDSRAEGVNPSLLFRNPVVPVNHVNQLQKSPFDGTDRWSTNPRDAGMRVVLPGVKGTRGTYYVRVRSAGPDLNDVTAGLTKGVYQLQVRLRELDEIPGTIIRSADIRYATTGIEVRGQPIHSPLSGEITEDTTPNDSTATAQQMGNLLNTDRATLGIAGRLAAATDIDFFQFSAVYTDVQQQSTAANPQYVAATFDVDYADGLGRPNGYLAIFDENGNLVLVAESSNVAEDQPGPLAGTNMNDLTRGSAGVLDPFLGTVHLPVGSYFAAMSNISRVPAELGQFSFANPSNPLLRLEPINSMRRIAEDHINSSGGSTADPPLIPVLLDNTSRVPWTLGDMTLYVSQDPGTLDQTNLHTVNPFTGQRVTQVGRFNFDVGDIALRPNGNLMSFSLDLENPPPADATTGIYFQINTGTAATTVVGASGIETYEDDPANPGNPVRSNLVGTNRIGHGIHFEAITFGHLGNGVERGFAVGSRPIGVRPPGITVLENIMYEFLPATGTAISAPAQDRTGQALLQGAGTQIVERGQLITDADPFGVGDTVIIAPEATLVDSTGLTNFIIFDGTRFAVNNGGVIRRFEFVSGPEVVLGLAPGRNPNPAFIRDGDTFFLDGQPFEFDTGEVLIVDAANGNFVQDGERFTVTDNQQVPVTRIFEWDNGSGPPLSGNVIGVPFNVGMTQAQLVSAVVNAINSQTGPAYNAAAQALPNTQFPNRISLLRSTSATENSLGMSIQGNTGRSTSRPVPNPPGTVLIPIEEVSLNADLVIAMRRVFNGQAGPPPIPGVPGITVGAEGNRVNFLGPANGNFSELVARGVFTDLNHDNQPNNPAAFAVPFLADDGAAQIATRMAAAINAAGLQATSNGVVVSLRGNLRFDRAGTDDPPLTIAGAAPGGLVTGMAFVGSELYAVSDRGGLYRIFNAGTPLGAVADYINTSIDLLGINFQALAAGPRNIDGGSFSDILFGIDVNGRLHAFDTNGVLQPVFANGQTSIDTGVFNANGLAFSNLDTNLWHLTNQRAQDAGHGINQPFDGSRRAVPGGNSYWFGWESQAANNVSINPFYTPGNVNNYDFPGGAHGSLVSHEFSLKGYSADDAPTLYFNYRLETENASAVLGANPRQFMRDAFRVFVASDDGVWHLLATNNSGRATGGFNDEYDDFNPFDGVRVNVQELYDVGDNGAPDSWRQARINLGPFAGRENLRLRFDFSTAASFDVGAATTTGSYLQAIPGNELRDSQRVLIDNDVFEFDLGATIVAPSGAALRDGETFTIHSQTFEFDSGGGVSGNNIPIRFDRTLSAGAIALEIERVLQTANYTLTANLRAETAGNEVISRAVVSGLAGGSDMFSAPGVIGDNPNLTVNPGLDVDMIRLNLNQGDTVQINVRAQQIGSTLNPLLRFFDVAGVPLALNDDAIGVDPQLNITVQRAGVYYVGISGSNNRNYDPVVEGFGVPGSTGNYEVDIIVNGFTGVTPRLHDNRIQLDGAVKVSQSAGAATVIDGQAGVSTGALRIPVNADMTSGEVALAFQQQLAARYSGNVLDAFPVDRDRVQIATHNVVAPGPLGLTNTLFGDQFGSFRASTLFDGTTNANFPGALRAQQNAFQGVFIDDLIIGFAERGEMATGAVADNSYFSNPNAPANQILVGEYQLEMRRSEEYGIGVPAPVPTLLLLRSFDTNDRLSQQHTLLSPAAHEVIDGQTFTLSDGVNSVVFEFEDINVGDGVAQGHFAIPFNPSAVDAGGGRSAESDVALARRIRDAINSTPVQAVLNLRAALSDGKANNNAVPLSTDSKINLFGNSIVGGITGTDVPGDLSTATEVNDTAAQAVVGAIIPGATSTYRAAGQIGDNPQLTGFNAPLDVDLVKFSFTAGTRVLIDIDAAEQGSPLDSMIRLFDVSGNELAFSDDNPAPGEPATLDPYLEFIIPVTGTYYVGISSFNNRSYTLNQQASGTNGFSTGFYNLEVTAQSGGIAFQQYNLRGDQNLFRDQGQLIIESNRISNSSGFGINIGAGGRDGPEGNPHQGPPRVTREVNAQRLVPGASVRNNVIFSNLAGGIRFAGDANPPGSQPAAVPFGRIVNNTLFGSRSGDTGIEVANNASPTLLNNIVSNFSQGINVDASSSTTVIGGMLYQGNTVDSNVGLGTFPISLNANDPLFLEPLAGNFYLQAGSQAIDSSINSLNDRPAMISVRNPLGIAVSPILAPQRDAVGQLRADDPSVEPPPGSGENVFIDRGAIDRADTAGPSAVMLDPRDNDAQLQDLDPRETFVKLSVQSLNGFSIELVDGVAPIDPANGSGLDDRTVTREQVTLLRDGQRLVEGVDYRFRYDALNNIIRLTPIAGIWETNHTYVIELANRDQFVITAPDGGSIADGDLFSINDKSGNTARFEYESGYTVTVSATLALQMPAAGGGLGGMTDRQSFTVNNGTTTVTFEFDNNGSVAAGSIPIVFTPQMSAEQLATAVVQALAGANIGLDPVDLGRGSVHLGVLPNHVVNISNAPSLTTTGSVNGGVRDGNVFTLDDGQQVHSFEFDRDNRITGSNTPISFTQRDTHLQIADKIVAAIRARTSLTPVHLGGGRIHLAGNLLTVLNTAGTQLTQAGRPGVTPEFGIRIPSAAGVPVGIADGQTFRIGNGIGLPVTFEFDTNGTVVPGNTIVAIPANNPSLNQIANAMVQAIASVGIGLTPVNVGSGRVILNDDTTSHFFDPLTSGLIQLGSPGVAGAVAVNYIPDISFTAQNMATVIAGLVNANTVLQDVSASTRGDRIIVDGASSVSGIIQVFVSGIRDIAGNVLRANQITGETQFTILLGSGFDFGDAPQSRGYPTLLANNGARHTIIPGFSLGPTVDVDVDGQPNLAADGDDIDGVDDEDGVTFGTLLRGYQSTITVNASGINASRPGMLDAFIDFNGDGDWNDPGEQIANGLSLVNGANVINITIPANAVLGGAYARFRLSSGGGLGPTGDALDGEVEDYLVNISASPWQNGARPTDVNGDGRETPFDVLQILTFLIRHGSVVLPVPPPFIGTNGEQIFPTGRMIDVNGDTIVNAAYAALVVGSLVRQRPPASGEGERGGSGAEGEARSSDALLSAGTSSSLVAAAPLALPEIGGPAPRPTLGDDGLLDGLSLRRPLSNIREVTFRLPSARADLSPLTIGRSRGDLAASTLDDVLDALADDGDRPIDSAHDEALAELFSN
jgi:hypothetical protein